MPAFLFDIVEDGHVIPAEDSFELADVQAARQQAIRAVGDMMAEAIPRADARRLQVVVKARDGRPILTVELNLGTVWHDRGDADGE